MADEKEEPNLEAGAEHLVRMLADGATIGEATSTLMEDPYHFPEGHIEKWYRDPVILQAVIEKSNDIIGQVWGTMWKSIKQKAMLGSIQHSKLLIEFLQNGKKLSDNTLKFVFEKAVSGDVVAEEDKGES